MYMYRYMYMYKYMYKYMYMCMCMYLYRYVYVCYIITCIYNICIRIHEYLPTCQHTCLPTCLPIYIHTCIHDVGTGVLRTGTDTYTNVEFLLMHRR